MINSKIKLIWTKYGRDIAIGIKHFGGDKKIDEQRAQMEQIYNFFYNFGLTNGSFHEMKDGCFGYFCLSQENLDRLNEIDVPMAKAVKDVMDDGFEREEFLREFDV